MPALRGAEHVLAQVPLGHAVELLVVRHDQVRVAHELEARGVDAAALELVELVDEHDRVDDDAVADDRRDVRVEDAARDELELEHLAVDDQGVAGVVAALVAHDHLAFLGEVVGELALALVTPVASEHDGSGHQLAPVDGSRATRTRGGNTRERKEHATAVTLNGS